MNQFLEACGATGPLLLNVEVPGGSAEARAYDLPFVLIGKDPRCDLKLDHPEVSSRHAYMQLVNGRLLCADLGSRGGVHQGGKRRRIGWLDRERAVRIGPYRIRLLSGDNHVPHDSGDAEDGLGGVEARGFGKHAFELSHRSVRFSRTEIVGDLALVGSAADCEVRLIDPSVASYHCALVSTPQGIWVVDLLGQGGIRVDGHEVSFGRLSEGISLTLGHSTVRMVSTRDEVTPLVIRPELVLGSEVAEPATAPLIVTTPEPDPPDREGEAVPSAQSNADSLSVEDSDDCNSGYWVEETASHEDGFVFGKLSANGRNGVATVRRGHVASKDLALPMSQAVELVERVLAPMLGQVGVMQRQMVDEIHQSRATMFEMFSALQQEQTSSLENELNQIRQISQELNVFRANLERQAQALGALNAKLAGGEAGPKSAQTAPPALAPEPEAVASRLPVIIPDRASRILPGWELEDDSPAFAATSTVRITPSSPPNGNGNMNGNGNTIGKSEFPGGPALISAVPTRLERRGPIVIPSFPVPKAATPTSGNQGPMNLPSGPLDRVHDENVHNQLCERIVSIREEHQSRWKRLLSMIPGGGTTRPTL